ncbi:DUF2849 domain-containing protein [Tepidamorphus sp. 3E244]|uniref:DUF2849 domain-containing protein n=1 Tax=Tepidamorphus sp. 3E244 TaxID=3385498 RepID=UPI0038FC0767
MSKSAPRIVSANDLLDGDVIYFTSQDGWSRDISDAAVVADDEPANDLLKRAEAQPGIAVGPYLVPVAVEDGVPAPLHVRERLRIVGPSVGPVKASAA